MYYVSVSYGTELQEVCVKYLRQVCDDEVIGLEGRESSIGSALAVVNVLLASWEDNMKFIQEGKGQAVLLPVRAIHVLFVFF